MKQTTDYIGAKGYFSRVLLTFLLGWPKIMDVYDSRHPYKYFIPLAVSSASGYTYRDKGNNLSSKDLGNKMAEEKPAPRGLEKVLQRNLYYWGNYRQLVLSAFLLLLLNTALAGFIIYQWITWPTPKYFATTTDGRPIPIINLALPYYDDPNVILDWASRAVQEIYTLDFVTWRAVLQDAEVFFTVKGYRDFLTALKESTNLNAVKTDKYVVSVAITGKPVMTRQGQRDPTVPYSWSLQIPVTVTYQNSENKINTQVGHMQMEVERASLLRHDEGIAIAQLVFVQP